MSRRGYGHGYGHGHMMRTYRAIDVVSRIGVALTVTWIYLRTLVVVPPGVDRGSWELFAWTGWPPVLLVWVGAVATFVAYLRER